MKNSTIIHSARADTLAAAIFLAPNVSALETLSPAEEKKFLDWSTEERKASNSVCSRTLKSIATAVPPSAVTTYISSQSSGFGFFMSNLKSQASAMAEALIAKAPATYSR